MPDVQSTCQICNFEEGRAPCRSMGTRVVRDELAGPSGSRSSSHNSMAVPELSALCLARQFSALGILAVDVHSVRFFRGGGFGSAEL